MDKIPSYYIYNVIYSDYILTVTIICSNTTCFHPAVNMAPFTSIKIAKLWKEIIGNIYLQK